MPTNSRYTTEENLPAQRPAQGSAAGSQGKGIEQKANQATQRAAEQAKSSFDNARTQASEQVGAVARAVESAAETLRQKDQAGLSRKIEPLVQKIEQASTYLKDKSPRELKDDVDRFARERPAWFLGGAFLLGVLAARFLKSSERGSVEYAGA
jgi:vacuolar-type H+-ATPase subunit H